MPNKGHFWTQKEDDWLRERFKHKPVELTREQFSERLSAETDGRISANAVKGRIKKFAGGVLSQSTYAVYDHPLEMEGDALVLTDVEFPFHHADFVNRCLELAKAWNIKNCILGGDVLHFDSLSGWEPSWTETSSGGIAERDAAKLHDFIMGLPSKQKLAGLELMGEIGDAKDKDGISTELNVARTELKKLQRQFDRVDFVLGNHEGRILRAIQTAIDPQELLRLLSVEEGKWRISPYYFSVLHSGGEKYQVEHPRNTSKFSAWKLAAKYQCHVLMGHSHQLNWTVDISGKYYALEIGACVDETRLPYAAQRHNTGHAHALGACIVRNGFPWLLTARSDWDALMKAV